MARQSRQKPVKATGSIRIIGGQWRGRKLPVLDAPGLRPTTDRVKETLFNWLQGRLEQKRCLDLFAGSGGLSFEALSRQVGFVQCIEKSSSVARQLQLNRQSLGITSEQFAIECTDTLDFLQQPPMAGFDIVFLDPPFRQQLLEPCCQLLVEQQWLNPGAFIYIELESEAPKLSVSWSLLRDKQAGQVHYQLYQVE
ncbi:16S rRNA (guanine(966)-N(2))-methyltransferase RsmD [Celerinatantimonas sp. YJH-8]|uniref:16S rRNA (guanine(966)-N(2))-methyltransferase RsmD n=1 Tax=Celerinatantimonas sp. YJH-8 TaxID=3228714 RepID=UPI0038CA7392